jgi:putative FmdB family regulatory protein
MPLYEYRCKSCGHAFEVIQKFSDRPLKTCRECSGPLEKLISRSSFQLKGGGWFIGDYSSSKAVSKPSEGESKTKSSSDADTTKTSCGSGSCPH